MTDWHPTSSNSLRVTEPDHTKDAANLRTDAAKLSASLKARGRDAEAVVYGGAIYLRGSYAVDLAKRDRPTGGSTL
jgi:hypothetical protein